MKIGILTYYFVHNYGAVLQAYAMQKVLEDMGHRVTFLKFDRNYDHIPEGADKKYNLSIQSMPLLINYLISNGVRTFYYNYIKKKRLHTFIKKNMKIGERYSDACQDAVLIGSDEVFAIDVGINPFLYGHNIPIKTIFSYAASFGSTQLIDVTNYGCKELIKAGFEKMYSIGVRDEITSQMVKSISNKDTKLNCDPVILYGYQNEIQKVQKKQSKEKYLILYSYDKNFNDRIDINIIKQFAKKYNMKIWSVGYYHKWCDKNIMCHPVKIIDLFCNAEMVITDTFHGSVISLITNTSFMVKLNKKNQKIEFLLEQYNILDRKTKNIKDINILFNQQINYDNINKLLKQEREKSMMFLKQCLLVETND